MPASFLQLPYETLEEIILAALSESPLGPPKLLHSLLLTCRDLYDIVVHRVHPTFYGRLFIQRFDLWAPHHRLGIQEALPTHLKGELQVQCAVLRCFRKVLAEESYDHPQLLDAFRTAYLMLLSDDGKNATQLRWAGLPGLVYAFLRHRLFPVGGENNGWPVENEINSLALALFWLLASPDAITAESAIQRKEIMDLIAPCSFAAIHFPCFDGPEYQVAASPEAEVETDDDKLVTQELSQYSPRLPTTEITYFGHTLAFTYPTLASFAILSYFARVEANIFGVPPHLPPTRAAANALGIALGPTQDDIVHFNTHCKTLIAERSLGDTPAIGRKSRRHDPDWHRALRYPGPSTGVYRTHTIHRPGTFTGRWQGSHIAPCIWGYKSLLSNPPSPIGAHQTVATARQPIYATFQEHYCFSPSVHVPWDDSQEFFNNGLLPPGLFLTETKDGISMTDPQRSFRAFYKTYRPELDDDDEQTLQSRYFGVTDIIITGQTDFERGQAWGAYTYVGRVRPCDGLVVLLRKPRDAQDAELGHSIFRGYLVSSQNLVGRWRHASSSDWEAIFTLGKSNA